METQAHIYQSKCLEATLAYLLQSHMVTYQPHNKLRCGHSLPLEGNKAITPRATMGKRLNYKDTTHSKQHGRVPQLLNEAKPRTHLIGSSRALISSLKGLDHLAIKHCTHKGHRLSCEKGQHLSGPSLRKKNASTDHHAWIEHWAPQRRHLQVTGKVDERQRTFNQVENNRDSSRGD